MRKIAALPTSFETGFWATCNDPEPSRWNRSLSKAFDVSTAYFDAASVEEAIVAKYLDADIKHLERRQINVMSVRMGAFLTATDAEMSKWFLDDLRNLDWRGLETTPVYDSIQLNSKETKDFLIDGMRFIRQEGERTVKAAFRVEPRWWGLNVTVYGIRSLGTAHDLLHRVQAAAKDINFLKGEAFSLSGEFLPTTGETFDDLFLDSRNAEAVRRIATLVNTKGDSLENRGAIFMGPAGTGKTLSARILRNVAKATFIWVSSRDFHYAGSFGGFTEAFDLARECAPSILVFEDVDNWLRPTTIDLIKSEMDGVKRTKGVVTLLTTNYPELLPAALIDRPGRFHDVLKFDLPGKAERTVMLQRWIPGLSERALTDAVNATEGYSGSHLFHLGKFVEIIREQEGLSLNAALLSALQKLAEQRELITSTQRYKSMYQPGASMVSQFGTRVDAAVVTKDFEPLDAGRAYSMLHIKAMDEDRREIAGIATTPEPDRVGDIIESTGVTFRGPIKLLLYHDKTKPVGSVEFDKPTETGVTFRAHIPKIAEPGVLRERVEEAWQSIKYKLLTGVSIGFRPIEGAVERLKSGGLRFIKTELLELSLVSVPAHQGATITMIKSLDAQYRRSVDGIAVSGGPQNIVSNLTTVHKTLDATRQAALGQTPVRVSLPSSSGVSDSTSVTARKDANPMRTFAEQRTQYENTRAAKAARMAEIMNTAGNEGVTLSHELSDEYDRLDAETRDIDQHLVRMASLERSQGASLAVAAPVSGGSVQAAAASRSGVHAHSVQVVGDRLKPGIEFARYAMCLASAKGFAPQALEIARMRYPDSQRIHTVLKAAVAAGTTTDPTWAGALIDYQNFLGDFVEFLRPQTIIGKFGTGGVPSLRQVPFNISVPGQTSGGDAWWVGEGKPKPVTKFDFAPVTLRWAKVANIAVLTDELVRFSSPSAEALVRDALAAAIIARIDTDFVDPTKAAVADVSPASITNGITAIPSSGSAAIDVRTDVAAIFGAFIAANLTPANGVWIMNANQALALSLMVNTLGQPEFPGVTMTGGTFMGLPVIVSQYVPTGIVILVNASDIYLSDDGQVVIDASREASLQMLDNPTNATADTASPPAPIATSLVSLWQTNSIGLKAERFINWQRRRDEAVQYLEDVAWAAGSPA